MDKIQDYDSAFFTTTLLIQLHAMVVIFLPFGKHLYDRIISLRGKVWAHKNNLAPPILIEVAVQI